MPDPQGGPGGGHEDGQHYDQGTCGIADDVEEVGAGLDPDGEGEQGQAEGADLRGDGDEGGSARVGDVPGRAPGGQRNAQEEDGGRAQADPPGLDVAHEHTRADQEEEDEDGVLGQVGEEVGDQQDEDCLPGDCTTLGSTRTSVLEPGIVSQGPGAPPDGVLRAPLGRGAAASAGASRGAPEGRERGRSSLPAPSWSHDVRQPRFRGDS